MALISRFKRQLAIAAAVAIWLPAVVFGINTLRVYSTTPGHPGSPPLHWPENASIKRGEGRPTLVMFLHPHCGCSRATLGELAIIMAGTKGQVEANVYFYLPASETSAWAESDLWRSATDIPGVQAFVDREATMAKSFGAFTSGQTLLYGVDGHLLFRGGITALRGHSGENAGRASVIALLSMDPRPVSMPLPVVSPVLGCSLRGEDQT